MIKKMFPLKIFISKKNVKLLKRASSISCVLSGNNNPNSDHAADII